MVVLGGLCLSWTGVLVLGAVPWPGVNVDVSSAPILIIGVCTVLLLSLALTSQTQL